MNEWTDLRAQLNRPGPADLPTFPAWPEITTFGKFKTELIEKPRLIVEHLLEDSSRMIFGGGAKTYKTWAMSDMALSINSGVPFWGFPTFQSLCLYVNFENRKYNFRRRLLAIEQAKGVGKIADSLLVWNLRGFEMQLEAFKNELLKRIRDLNILVVFIDPFYKLLGAQDERVSATINPIMAAFDEINRITGATIVFSAHFTKGNQASTESIDRISGGGAISRDPDSLVTLTRHNTEQAFSVEFTLRDFAPLEPFVVRWVHPLLVRDDDLDPTDLKRLGKRSNEAKAKTQNQQEFTIDDVVTNVHFTQSMRKSLLESICMERKMSRRRFEVLLADAIDDGRLYEFRASPNGEGRPQTLICRNKPKS
jgi:hypothetical protein